MQLLCRATRFQRAQPEGARSLALPALLLVAVLAKPLLPLVGRDLVTLTLTSGWHKSGGQGGGARADEDRRRRARFQTPTCRLPRPYRSKVRNRTPINLLFTPWDGRPGSTVRGILFHVGQGTRPCPFSLCTLMCRIAHTLDVSSPKRAACSPPSALARLLLRYRTEASENASFAEACSSEGASSARRTAHHGC